MTNSGYEYSIDETNATERVAQLNDFVEFGYKVVGSNNVELDNFSDENNLPSVRVPDLNDPKNAQYKSNPVMEILSSCRLGAIYNIIMPIDSMPARERNPKLDSLTHVSYVIDVRNILSEEEYKVQNEKKQAMMKAKSAEVETKVAGILTDYKAGKLDVKISDTGLKYVIHEEGSGPMAKVGDFVDVKYFGVLEADGNKFDDSFSRGKPFSFTLGQGAVIKGWDEGITYLNKGAKATLIVPYDLAYGEAGRPSIPPKSNLVFYVELADIKN